MKKLTEDERQQVYEDVCRKTYSVPHSVKTASWVRWLGTDEGQTFLFEAMLEIFHRETGVRAEADTRATDVDENALPTRYEFPKRSK